jgi:hypothetical protein
MKHFVGMKKEQGMVATLFDFNRWFGDAESKDLRKVWFCVVFRVARHRLLLNLPQDFKAAEKAHLAKV